MTRFQAAGPLRGTLRPPADKSISHRAALFGAMCDTPVAVRNYLYAEDTLSTLDALRALGAAVEMQANELVIRGVGMRAPLTTTNELLDVGNSGTLMRLLPGWLAGQPGGRWTLDGDASIRRRPVDRVARPLDLMGARVGMSPGGRPPFTVEGAELTGIDYVSEVASAQVKSCVLIAGLMAHGSTSFTEPTRSRDHTERFLAGARVPFERHGSTVRVWQCDELELEDIDVPADPSSAAFFVAAASIVQGSRIVLEDVGLNWTRTAFFQIAQRMGAVVLGDLESPGTDSPDEPIGEVDVANAPLVATEVGGGEVPLAIDELPLVALLGVFADGETVVRDAEELRVKETDRIESVVHGLRGLGAEIEATGDGFVVQGTGRLRGGVFDSRGDHRMAMLGAVAGLASEEGVEVQNMTAASVSYPSFESDLRGLLTAA
ncbi:MAG TPA: 3-phosphoshikimate 1-carboxyvinyltransferase [Thermoleophilaceae bacterium]|nr:3-phosphoshikimate 1-carboxyvinyltransferase [Thermoleophilaceae bacterium]